MFKNPFQVAVVFALVALGTKLMLLLLNVQHDNTSYVTLAYMLFLLCAVFFGIRSNKITQEKMTSFGEDFRTGARTASYFALLVGVITYIYYTKIDPDFFPIKITNALAEDAKGIPDAIKEKGFAEAKTLFKTNIISRNAIYSPISQTTYTLFGLVFLGLFHAGIFALLMKKYPGFKK